MTPEEKALRDAFLAELWPTCRELSRDEREMDRLLAEARCEQPVEMPVDKRHRRAS